MFDKPGRTAPTAVLLDASGAPLPKTKREPVTVDVRALPRIAGDAAPRLPGGIEARLYEDPNGHNHQIVLWCPEHEISVIVPLARKAEIADAAVMMERAIAYALRPALRLNRTTVQ